MNIQLRQMAGVIFILLVVIMIVYLYIYKTKYEGYVDVGRCGVGMPPCSDGLRCMNGYCKSDIPKELPKFSDLPIRPPRYPYSH